MALSKIYGILDPDNDVVKNIKSVISSGIWSGGSGTLTTFYTQSVQSASSGDYYVDVYKTNPQTDTTSEIQFSEGKTLIYDTESTKNQTGDVLPE